MSTLTRAVKDVVESSQKLTVRLGSKIALNVLGAFTGLGSTTGAQQTECAGVVADHEATSR